jgi:hypothetical protein
MRATRFLEGRVRRKTGAAPVGRRLERQPPAVLLGDALRHRQAEAAAAAPAADEGIEQPLAQLGRHPGSGVAHGQARLAVRQLGTDGDGGPLPARLRRVEDQVEEGATQARLVGDDGQPLGDARLEVHAGGGGGQARRRHQVGDQRAQIDGAELERRVACQAGETPR